MPKSASRIDNLPDEVIILIMDKLSDPKSLLMSSLISKSIASALSHRNSLLIRFPPLTSPPPSWDLSLDDDIFTRLTNLLRRFDHVQSLRLEVPCTCRNPETVAEVANNFKWKAKVGCQIEIFSYLSMHLVGGQDHSPTNEQQPEGEQVEEENEDIDDDNLVGCSYHEISGPSHLATSMHNLILLLVAHHPNLQGIEIIDSENHGGIAANHEAVSNIRNALAKDTLANMLDSSCKITHFMVWYEPKMKLKLSKIKMEKVRLVICTHKRLKNQKDENNNSLHNMLPSPNDFDINAALLGGFEYDQDDVFEATMVQLLAEHDMKAIISPF